MSDQLAILWHYLRVRYRRPFRSRDALERWQMRRFAELARRVLVRSPFYEPFVGQPLSEYPIVDKSTMVEAFDRMNTLGLRRSHLTEMALRAEASRDFTPMLGEIAVGLSSGTSGRRGLFVTSRAERRRYAGVVLAKGLRDGLRKPTRIALLLRANNPLYESVNASRRVTFGFFDLLAPFAKNVRRLETFAPDVLIGPPQALRLVADAVAAREIRLVPRAVFAGAEVLDAVDAAAIEAGFGVRVDQIYQATEGFLGITCREGTLHLNEDGMVVERRYLSGTSDRFIPVLTDLFRSTQPIVRYRLDDVLVERTEPCPCGSVLQPLLRIEGRADDILFLPPLGGGKLIAVMPDFVRDRLARAHPAIADFRVIQHAPGEVELLLDAPAGAAGHARALAALRSVFDGAGVEQPRVHIGPGIPRDLARKLRRVERRFPLPSDACAF